jgi:hypothetical protein
MQRGDVVMHAGAMNMQYENMLDPIMAMASFDIAKNIAADLGVAAPATASLRDVPGVTRSMIPVFRAANITALTIGVNQAVPPPDMPNPGLWVDPNSGAQLLFLQHNSGYPDMPGTDPANPMGLSRSDCVVVPGWSEALCWAFRQDNQGPPESVAEVQGYYSVIHSEFPGAKVVAAAYDDFTGPLFAQGAHLLPVVTNEVGDTWLEGVTSDITKMIYYREMSRAYMACLQNGLCDPLDMRIRRFLRYLLKTPEHTWGLPALQDNTNWTNAAFHAAKDSHSANYDAVQAAWYEQRQVAFDYAMDALGDHPLAADIRTRLQSIAPSAPQPSGSNGYAQVPAGQWAQSFVCNGNGAPIFFSIDPSTGGLASVVLNGHNYAGGSGSSSFLGQFVYQTYNDTDLVQTVAEYQYQVQCCFDKPGSQAIANPQRLFLSPTITSMWSKPTPGGGSGAAATCEVLVEMAMPAFAVQNYGAPASIWLNVSADNDAQRLLLDLQLFNKTQTRLDEALWFAFTPAPTSSGAYLMDKMNGLVDPLVTCLNGSNHQHGISSGVRYVLDATNPSTSAYLQIDSLDSPLVSPATAVDPPTMLPNPMTPLEGPVESMYFSLSTNTWNTNYLFWSLDSDYRFRFAISAGVGGTRSGDLEARKAHSA